MSVATMTTKGQITVPHDVRQRLNLRTGTKVEFVERADGGVDLVPLTASIMDLAGIVPWDGPPVSIEEMDEAVQEAAVERYLRSFAK